MIIQQAEHFDSGIALFFTLSGHYSFKSPQFHSCEAHVDVRPCLNDIEVSPESAHGLPAQP